MVNRLMNYNYSLSTIDTNYAQYLSSIKLKNNKKRLQIKYNKSFFNY